MLEIIRQAIGEGWEFTSAGGLTGNAYIAKKEDERIFLKRNSSPFLAVLSAEGIVPQLIWTKRIKNGDVITAQKWLDGRELYPQEMREAQVAKKLRQIHQSSELLHMLMRLGIEPTTPAGNLERIEAEVKQRHLQEAKPQIDEAIGYLRELLPEVTGFDQVVCHADITHNNMMYAKDGSLYIVDWDQAMIADPVIDFGSILYYYVPEEQWEAWLQHYGLEKDRSLLLRMYWYLIDKALTYYLWHKDREENKRAQACLLDLQNLNQAVAAIL